MNLFTGGYISSLHFLKEFVCYLDCDCLNDLDVVEEIESINQSNKKFYTLSTIDTIIDHKMEDINIIINFYLPMKNSELIYKIIKCLSCVDNLETENYVIHKSSFKLNDTQTTEVRNNNQKIYNGTLSVEVSQIKKKGQYA